MKSTTSASVVTPITSPPVLATPALPVYDFLETPTTTDDTLNCLPVYDILETPTTNDISLGEPVNTIDDCLLSMPVLVEESDVSESVSGVNGLCEGELRATGEKDEMECRSMCEEKAVGEKESVESGVVSVSEDCDLGVVLSLRDVGAVDGGQLPIVESLVSECASAGNEILAESGVEEAAKEVASVLEQEGVSSRVVESEGAPDEEWEDDESESEMLRKKRANERAQENVMSEIMALMNKCVVNRKKKRVVKKKSVKPRPVSRETKADKLANDPNYFFMGAPSTYESGQVADILHGAKTRALQAGIKNHEVKFIPSNLLCIQKIEETTLVTGEKYRLTSYWIEKPEDEQVK